MNVLEFSKIETKKSIPEEWDVIILGAGPAGLSAALYSGRSMLKTLVIDENCCPGGQLNRTEIIEDYPGVKRTKAEMLVNVMEEQAKEFGAELLYEEEVVKVWREGKNIKVKTRKGKIFTTKVLIIATGSSYKRLGVPGELEYMGKGVSNCAVCDGAFFKGKIVAVVGGGNTAVEEGLYLTRFASKVILIHRRDKLKADKVLQERAFKNEKMEFIWDTVVEEIIGDGEKVTGVRIRNKKTGETKTLNVDGVFIFIGLVPNSKIFEGFVEMDERGHIITNEKMETSQPGVYAVGDVRNTVLMQAITAAADGAIAGHFAHKYIEESWAQ